eukprot:3190449-Ditylum_brightwellii.AAC.1
MLLPPPGTAPPPPPPPGSRLLRPHLSAPSPLMRPRLSHPAPLQWRGLVPASVLEQRRPAGPPLRPLL